MHWEGVLIGAGTFLLIGVFHPIVVKCEYYFGKRIWPLFLICGLCSCVGAVFVGNVVISSLLAVLGFTMFWSIGELRHQEKRVAKGWFPANPKRAEQSLEQPEASAVDK